MKTTLYFISILFFLSISNLDAQEVEGGGVIKLSLKTTPELIIEKITFFDENNNDLIDAGEQCYFELIVKNTGKTHANKPIVKTKLIEDNTALLFETVTNSVQINAGQSGKIKVPISGGNNLKTGATTFEFSVSDAGKYISKSKQFIQKHKAKKIEILLTSEWYYPVDFNTTVDESKINIRLCIKTKHPVIEVLVYINNTYRQVIKDIEPTSNDICNYMIIKEVYLEKGENEIKLKIKTKDKEITSEKRIVIYEPKITEYRNALVIGNSKYKTSALKNPANDAKAIANALRELNFDVIEIIDADKVTMRNAVRKFKEKMKEERGVGLFYYAGHGVQVKDENYLIPVNHDIKEEYDIQDEALRMNTIIAYMQDAGTRMNIVILDACRDNPFAGSMRSGSRGLASIYAEGSGTLIAYATSPGSTASDGEGKNGLYTQELLKAIQTPGLEIGMIFRKVLGNVQRLSGGKQIPWTNSSITGEFYFIK
ncbi:MAG: caspase family protein [Bacteroidales bacterium]|nr:caspase family protein [Bacteroidales bacterium]